MPVLAVSVMLDGQQCVLSGTSSTEQRCMNNQLQQDAHSELLDYVAGVVRGCGRQKTGAFINLAAYYLAGIPAAFVFAFLRRLGGMVLFSFLYKFRWK